MIAKYHDRANYAAGAWLASLVILVPMLMSQMAPGANIWEGDYPWTRLVFVVHAFSMVAACWYFAKAKGYWGILGATLGFASFIGLALLLIIPDRR